MSDLYPFRFRTIYKNYIWGGRRFETAFDRELARDGIYAESWEVADHPDGESIVAEGPLAGKSLRELRESYSKELFGKHHPQSVFPLLLKYLDANQHLSLQVHPDDQCATAMGLADPGKTEAWYVIEAAPGSCLWAGFAQPVDRAVVEKALHAGDIERLLHRVEPRPGDCIFVPAGTVHAIGAGLLVAEIQQMSNNTFRLSDWGRVDADGNPRPLHIEQGSPGNRLLKRPRPAHTRSTFGQAGSHTPRYLRAIRARSLASPWQRSDRRPESLPDYDRRGGPVVGQRRRDATATPWTDLVDSRRMGACGSRIRGRISSRVPHRQPSLIGAKSF